MPNGILRRYYYKIRINVKTKREYFFPIIRGGGIEGENSTVIRSRIKVEQEERRN